MSTDNKPATTPEPPITDAMAERYTRDDEECIIERVAKAICRGRMLREVGPFLAEDDMPKFEASFAVLWAGQGELAERQRASYRGDATAALEALHV